VKSTEVCPVKFKAIVGRVAPGAPQSNPPDGSMRASTPTKKGCFLNKAPEAFFETSGASQRREEYYQ